MYYSGGYPMMNVLLEQHIQNLVGGWVPGWVVRWMLGTWVIIYNTMTYN